MLYNRIRLKDLGELMRADRLLSLLLLLQSRGRMTARELAERLEVSERTIYRDLDALGAAGVPVYGDHGPGGGYALVDSYRTNLTGLTEAEAGTLFLSNAQGPLADLGLAETLDVALLKLMAALPSSRRREAEAIRSLIHLDPIGWFQPNEPVPHLQTLHEALWQRRRVRIVYRPTDGSAGERVVDPYGLVAKANIWYLVGVRDDEMRVYRASRVLEANILDECFERPENFDLSAFWTAWCAEFEKSLSRCSVTLRIAPDFVPTLIDLWGENARKRLENAKPSGADGWLEATFSFDSFEWARTVILGLGTGVEVAEPLDLRESVAQWAGQIAQFYARR